MNRINKTKITLACLLSLTLSACLTTPAYVEPADDNSAELIILNKTLNNKAYDFIVYENSQNCTGATQYNESLTNANIYKDRRKRISMKIPARNDFTFMIETTPGSASQRCYMVGTFDAKKGSTYVATLKNHGFCKVKLSRKISSNKLTPEKSLITRRPIIKGFGEADCREGEWTNPMILTR